MSSTYKAICLNHDPALYVGRDWSNPADALATVESRDDGLEQHTTCDLLIGRYSGALIEICCPPHQPHAEPRWIDASWLRLAIAAANTPDEDPAIAAALAELARVNRCWRQERIGRLARLLER